VFNGYDDMICVIIRLPTDATLCFVYLFLYFTLHVSGSHKSIITGVSSCFLYIEPFGSCSVYVAHLRVPVDWFVVMVSLCMNQMVIYKKQLETPLMMGL